MVCLATTNEALAAAIDLAREKNKDLEAQLRQANAEIARLKLELVSRVDSVPSFGVQATFEAEAELHGLSIDSVDVPVSDESQGSMEVYEYGNTEEASSWWKAGWYACHRLFLEKLELRDKAEYDPFDGAFIEPNAESLLSADRPGGC